MSEPNDGTPNTPVPVDPELVAAQNRTKLEVWQARQEAQLNFDRERLVAEIEMRRAQTAAELAAAVDSGLTAKLAMARAIALADIAPAGFAAERKPTGEPREGAVETAAANIVLVMEMGQMLGFNGLQSLMHMQVIKKNVSLKPTSARGMMRSRKIRIRDEWTYSNTGFPIACKTSAIRPDDDADGLPWDEWEYRIEDAAAMGLCAITKDDNGTIVGVRARSKQGEPQNWEKTTKTMLMWRATSALTRAYYSDITGGMAFESDFEPEHAGPAAEPAPAPAGLLDALQKVAATRTDNPGGSYDPTADLALFSDADPWWSHAGAQVTRRTKKQMAADRLAAAGGDDRIPQPPENPNAGTVWENPDVSASMSRPDPADIRSGVTNDPFAVMGADLAEPDPKPYEPEPMDVDNTFGADEVKPDVLPGFNPDDDTTWPEPDENWSPSAQAEPENKEQLLARLTQTIEAIGRPREDLLARFYVLRGGRTEDDWTEDEIRDVLRTLNQ